MTTILNKDEQSLLKKFKRCVDERSLEKMDKKLYRFFMYECTFIAHYSIHGFRDEYSGKDFLRWFQVFANPDWMFFNSNGNHEELKRACVQYAKEQQTLVYATFERIERNQKVKLLQALQAELFASQPKQDNKPNELLVFENEDGQMSLFG